MSTYFNLNSRAAHPPGLGITRLVVLLRLLLALDYVENPL